MNRPVRLGIIGVGNIGSVYAVALQGLDGAALTAVADSNEETAAARGRDFGVPHFAGSTELVASELCEAVLLCTPPNTHQRLATALVTSGVHVMCEKPMATGVEDAYAMVEAANASGVMLTMASKFRYVEDVIKARQIIDSGILGDVLLFENTFAARVDMADRWNADPYVAGGGVIIDNGTHSVDVVRFLLGPVADVMAVEGKRVQQLDVEDTAQLFIRSTGGVRATVDLSWSLDKERDSYIDIYGSDGVVRVGWKSSIYRQHPGNDWVVFGDGYDKLGSIERQLANFVGAIRGGERMMISSQDAIASVEVIDAAYQSLARDDWVPVSTGWHSAQVAAAGD